ncbi:MAG: hypothetical protein HOV81_17855 [Kofleriaceae bacterium]|nr:hypothetical protein [Kofleriaceae bacterium]
MGFAFALIFLIFAVPIGLYVWYVAIHVPARGRARQEQSWRPLAERIGGNLVASTGTSRFHGLTVPYGATSVRALVFDRAAHDPSLPQMRAEFGGWRTFVQADVPGARGVPLSIQPRGVSRGGIAIGRPALEQHHVITPLLATQPQAIGWRITPDLEQALAVLGNRYDYVQAGPAFVNLEIPGVCTDPVVLEAALRVVGALAQPAS